MNREIFHLCVPSKSKTYGRSWSRWQRIGGKGTCAVGGRTEGERFTIAMYSFYFIDKEDMKKSSGELTRHPAFTFSLFTFHSLGYCERLNAILRLFVALRYLRKSLIKDALISGYIHVHLPLLPSPSPNAPRHCVAVLGRASGDQLTFTPHIFLKKWSCNACATKNRSRAHFSTIKYKA